MSVNNESVFRWVLWRKARGNIVLPCRPLTPYETHVVVERQLEWVGTELPLRGIITSFFLPQGVDYCLPLFVCSNKDVLPGSAR